MSDPDLVQEWIHRIEISAEDFDLMGDPWEWNQHLKVTGMATHGRAPTVDQQMALELGRQSVIAEVGYKAERHPLYPWEISYREVTTGQFRSKAEAMFNLQRYLKGR